MSFLDMALLLKMLTVAHVAFSMGNAILLRIQNQRSRNQAPTADFQQLQGYTSTAFPTLLLAIPSFLFLLLRSFFKLPSAAVAAAFATALAAAAAAAAVGQRTPPLSLLAPLLPLQWTCCLWSRPHMYMVSLIKTAFLTGF